MENGNPFNLPSFREEFSEILDDKLKPITDLLAKHDRDIDRHESALQRAKGARWAFGIIWVALSVAWEWLIHGSRH